MSAEVSTKPVAAADEDVEMSTAVDADNAAVTKGNAEAEKLKRELQEKRDAVVLALLKECPQVAEAYFKSTSPAEFERLVRAESGGAYSKAVHAFVLSLEALEAGGETAGSPDDVMFECCSCHKEFPFSAEEQEFFKAKGWDRPNRCPACRAARKAHQGQQTGQPNRPPRVGLCYAFQQGQCNRGSTCKFLH